MLGSPLLLWSDWVFWLLVVMLLVYARAVWRNPLQRSNWARVFQSRMATASAVVLVAVFSVTLLDSMHIRLNAEAQKHYGQSVISVLDTMLGPMVTQKEKSYSAPLATHLLSREQMEVNGVVVRGQPRLTFGGAHLQDDKQRNADLLRLSYHGLLLGVLVWVGFLLVLWVIRCYLFEQQCKHEATKVRVAVFSGSGSYHAMIWSTLVLCLVASVVMQWSNFYHVLGTDKVGTSVLYSSIKSLRTAMLIGLLATVLTLPLGIVLGLLAGYFRGWVDDVIQYVYTTLNAIPSVLLIAASMLMMQVVLDANPNWFTSSAEKADVRLVLLCAILGLTSWTGLARLLRGEVLKLREEEYVLAAKAVGASHGAILFHHLLPNLMHLVLIVTVMEFSGLVLAEAVLSYVGVGVDPTTHSFGTLINAARLELSREPVVWWSLASAFAFMLALVLAANLFADAVRNAFDPRARQLKQSLLRV